MTLIPHLPSTAHRSTAEQQHEVREARRLLKERIRTDWEFPTLPQWKSCGRTKKPAEEQSAEERIAGFRFHVPRTDDSTSRRGDSGGEVLGLDFDPLEWRERSYSSAEDTEDEGDKESGSNGVIAKAKAKAQATAYKFENADSVGPQLRDGRQARKRKRHAAVQQEIQWNDGLEHWMRRRDAWCCARPATDVRILQEEQQHEQQTLSDEQPPTTDSSSTSSSSPRTSTSSTTAQVSDHQTSPPSSISTTPDLPPPTTTTSTTMTATTTSPDILLPLAPPLLPHHNPIRRRIQPSLYPEIYSKIILQSRTPSVPINLRVLVHALVQGWKDDGEWPPKSSAGAAPEKAIGRRRKDREGSHGGLKEGVKAVGRVLRLTTGAGDG